jgi:hypothetical protein
MERITEECRRDGQQDSERLHCAGSHM